MKKSSEEKALASSFDQPPPAANLPAPTTRVTGDNTNPPVVKLLGWLAAIIMMGAGRAMVIV